MKYKELSKEINTYLYNALFMNKGKDHDLTNDIMKIIKRYIK